MKDYSYVTAEDYRSVAGPDWPTFEQFQLQQDIPEWVVSEVETMLKPAQSFDHPSFCVLPFYGWEFPNHSPCCLLPATADITNIKQKMLAGQRPADCNSCWKIEDSGLKSDRQLKNSTLDFYSKTDIQRLFEQAQAGQNYLSHYKIDTSNVCNAACPTCDSHYSSLWGKLEQKNLGKKSVTWRIKTESLQIDYPRAEIIMFRGGEPFLSNTNFEILEKLIAVGNTDCFVSFVTNGSKQLTTQQVHILKHFSNVNIAFSIDGTGPVFEYMRWPLKWNKLVETVDQARSLGFMVSADYTVSNLNIWYYQETVAWFRQQGLDYHICLVKKPQYFAASNLPEDFKQKVIQNNYQHPEVATWLAAPCAPALWQKFKTKVLEQDQWKQISVNHYLPALSQVLS